jgi:large subunit ribosomal protein L10
MSRLIKEKMVERYQSRFRDVTDVAVVSTQGVDVLKMTALRSTLRAKGIRAMVVHNRIGRRALAGVGLEGLKDLLHGPSTLVWGGESIVDIAKVLAAQARTLAALKIRGGVSGGQVLTGKDFEALSQLPGRLELIGRAVALAIGAGARVAAQIKAPGGRIVSQVREYEKKASAAEAAAAEAAPPDEAAAAPVPEAAAAPAAPASEAAPATEAPKAGQPPAAPKA